MNVATAAIADDDDTDSVAASDASFQTTPPAATRQPRDPSAQRESKRAIERDRTPSFASLRAGRSTPGRARREAPR